MKRRIGFLIAVIFVCVFLCSACQPYQYYGRNQELYSVFGSAVPGAASPASFTGKSVKIIEKDSYGRVLFAYDELIPFYADDFTCGYAICQHYDGKLAYYLCDICFEIDDSYAKITTDRINALKERNNWEKPLELDADGMETTWIFSSFRYGGERNNLYLKYSATRDIKKLIKESFSPEELDSEKLSYYAYEIYEDGRAFFIIKSFVNEKRCIIALNSDGTLYEGSPLWIDDPYSAEYIEQLVKFRAEFEAASAGQA